MIAGNEALIRVYQSPDMASGMLEKASQSIN
jgi:hypothetical protein